MPVQPSRPTIRVSSYTKRDGTKVRSHDRRAEWKKAAAAWSTTAAAGTVSAALVAELGFTLISAVAMVLTALVLALAVALTRKLNEPKRKMRAKTRKPAPRRPAPKRKKTSRSKRA